MTTAARRLLLAALWRKHRIAHRRVAGCFVRDELRERVHGFNTVMTAEIQRRFGADALEVAPRKAGCD